MAKELREVEQAVPGQEVVERAVLGPEVAEQAVLEQKVQGKNMNKR